MIPESKERRRANREMSRRTLLLGAGMFVMGTAACTCGGLSVSALLWLAQSSDNDLITPTVATPTSTQPEQLTIPSIVSRASWGALPPDHRAPNERGFYSEDNISGWRIYGTEIHEAYQTVVIHHSANYLSTDVETLLDIQLAHREDRGWADIAYHYLVGKNGLIYEGRDWHVRGTHVEAFNTGSLGICLLGDFMSQAPTSAQLNSTMTLINWISERLQLTHIASHRAFNPETHCPGDQLLPYLEQFARAAGLVIGTDGYIPPTQSAAHCFCCACDTII